MLSVVIWLLVFSALTPTISVLTLIHSYTLLTEGAAHAWRQEAHL